MKIILIFLFFTCAFVHRSNAQSISVSVDDSEISLAGIVKLTITLENAEGNFEPPSFNDFRVVNGPFSSTSMQIMNGVMSSNVAYTYLLSPKKEGDLYIEEAYIKLADTTLVSVPIKIIVSPSAPINKQKIEKRSEYKGQVNTDDKKELSHPVQRKKRKIIKF
jgi:hypothetical protein